MAISSISELMKKIRPQLSKRKCYFALLQESRLMEAAALMGSIVCMHREKEGVSVVFYEDAKESFCALSSREMHGPFALITLAVDSDLLAVGFLAKITAALAKEKISANAISAYCHDYLLVPYGRKNDALSALRRLSKE